MDTAAPVKSPLRIDPRDLLYHLNFFCGHSRNALIGMTPKSRAKFPTNGGFRLPEKGAFAVIKNASGRWVVARTLCEINRMQP